MKSNRTMLFNFLIILFAVFFLPLLLTSNRIKRTLEINQNKINLTLDKITQLKEQFSNESNEPVTKADLIAFTELNNYNNQISQLKLEGRMESLNSSPSNIPIMIISFMILLYL